MDDRTLITIDLNDAAAVAAAESFFSTLKTFRTPPPEPVSETVAAPCVTELVSETVAAPCVTEPVSGTVAPAAPDPGEAFAPVATGDEPSPVELDGLGLPWDSRINTNTPTHGKTKVSRAPHNWKVKPTPKDQTKEQWAAYVEQIRDQLRAAMSAPSPPAPVAASPLPTSPTSPAAPVAAAPSMPPPAAAPAVVDINAVTEFPDFLAVTTAANITREALIPECVKVGLDDPFLLSSRPDLIPQVLSGLKAAGYFQ